jgi:hypothetical protein
MAQDAVIPPSRPFPERASSAAAVRMARHRERRRNGLRCLTIELSEAEIDQFIRRKRLAPEDRANPAALRRTLYEFLRYSLW